MAPIGMNASVSMARAMLILSSCLIFGTLIGLLPHNGSGQNLRTKNGQHQQQKSPATGGFGIKMPQLPDVSLFSRPSSPAKEAENRVLAEEDNFVWKGDLAAIREHGLDELALSMDFEFSFAFEGSFSYDYDY